MITIFICKDDALAKEITSKYLSRDKLPYVSMLDDITYQQAVDTIESMKPGKIQQKEAYVQTESSHQTLLSDGWTPIACTNECLDTKDGEIFIAIAYWKGLKRIQNSDFIKRTTLDELVKEHSMEILEESKFNKKYPNRNTL